MDTVRPPSEDARPCPSPCAQFPCTCMVLPPVSYSPGAVLAPIPGRFVGRRGLPTCQMQKGRNLAAAAHFRSVFRLSHDIPPCDLAIIVGKVSKIYRFMNGLLQRIHVLPALMF